MAQVRKVITNIGEATCLYCIYSYIGDDGLWCRKAHMDDIRSKMDYWCGHGLWLVYTGRKEEMNIKPNTATLEEVYEWFTE